MFPLAAAPVQIGDITSGPVLVAIRGFLLMAAPAVRGVPGAILLGLLATGAMAFPTGWPPCPTPG